MSEKAPERTESAKNFNPGEGANLQKPGQAKDFGVNMADKEVNSAHGQMKQMAQSDTATDFLPNEDEFHSLLGLMDFAPRIDTSGDGVFSETELRTAHSAAQKAGGKDAEASILYALKHYPELGGTDEGLKYTDIADRAATTVTNAVKDAVAKTGSANLPPELQSALASWAQHATQQADLTQRTDRLNSLMKDSPYKFSLSSGRVSGALGADIPTTTITLTNSNNPADTSSFTYSMESPESAYMAGHSNGHDYFIYDQNTSGTPALNAFGQALKTYDNLARLDGEGFGNPWAKPVESIDTDGDRIFSRSEIEQAQKIEGYEDAAAYALKNWSDLAGTKIGDSDQLGISAKDLHRVNASAIIDVLKASTAANGAQMNDQVRDVMADYIGFQYDDPERLERVEAAVNKHFAALGYEVDLSMQTVKNSYNQNESETSITLSNSENVTDYDQFTYTMGEMDDTAAVQYRRSRYYEHIAERAD